MNKKFLFGMFAAATMLFATSCSNDELDGVQSGKESVVSFTLEQPSIATRAYSDGLTATKLTYAVYEKGTKNAVKDGTGTFSNKTANVSIELTTGKSYDFIFWADAEGSPYTFSIADQTVTVNYDNPVSQDENRDAFFAAKTFDVNGPISETITLYRPFAQLNIGVNSEATLPTKTSVEVSNVYETLNLLDGSVAGGRKVSFGEAAIPEGQTFPVAGYSYLAMNYLLVDVEKENVDVTFTTSDGVVREYPAVPVQRNYRTNIYGKILTSNADFNITIDQRYEEPDYTYDSNEAGSTGLSVEWATMNVGASSAEELGTYYAWGGNVDGLTKVTEEGKKTNNWVTYEWYTSNGDNGTTLPEEMKKYSPTDGQKSLLIEDDIAATMGEGWRTPTKDEMQELLDKCTWTWNAEKKGYDVVEKDVENPQIIFLPAGGYYRDNNKTDNTVGSYCCYWTSTLTDTWVNAYCLEAAEAETDEWLENEYIRPMGCLIRPVRNK